MQVAQEFEQTVRRADGSTARYHVTVSLVSTTPATHAAGASHRVGPVSQDWFELPARRS